MTHSNIEEFVFADLMHIDKFPGSSSAYEIKPMRAVSVESNNMVQGKSSSSSSANSTPKAAHKASPKDFHKDDPKEPPKEQTSFLGKIGQMVKSKLTSSSSSSSSVDEESRVQGESGNLMWARGHGPNSTCGEVGYDLKCD